MPEVQPFDLREFRDWAKSIGFKSKQRDLPANEILRLTPKSGPPLIYYQRRRRGLDRVNSKAAAELVERFHADRRERFR